MSIVYVLGAGASYGESLLPINPALNSSRATPPTTTGFSSRELLEKLGYAPEHIEKEFPNLMTWIRFMHLGNRREPLGDGEWKSINIEDVFTWLEIRREFESPESGSGAKLLGWRAELLSYIFRIIGLCTSNSFGEYSRALGKSLQANDSIITFNWDLLIDDCFLRHTGDLPHYTKFKAKFSEVSEDNFFHVVAEGSGLFLKLHGSLNWFQCTNPRCAVSRNLLFRDDIDRCLQWSIGINKSYACDRCASEAMPLIVPPVLRKPITEQETIRAAWGLARSVLAAADVLVVIGFSVAPTDYYASWLLREAAADRLALLREVAGKPPLKVIIANPLNDPKKGGHQDFEIRMKKLFPQGYDSRFRSFSEVAEICAHAKAEERGGARAGAVG
jgi:hypothetical protein